MRTWPWRGRLLPGGNLPCEMVPVFSPSAELRRVAAEQDWPRLRVRREEFVNLMTDERRWFWCWEITSPSGWVIEKDRSDSHPQALAVGLAALEVASVAGPAR